jgi:hypothetical protein
MRYFKYFALLAVLVMVPAVYSHGQVAVGVRIGPDYGLYNAPPVCDYGFYPDYPYGCAPYGYWGPDYFVDGVFIGVGPWYNFYHRYPRYWGGYFVGGGFRDRGFRRFDRDRGFRGGEFRSFRGEGFRGERGFDRGRGFVAGNGFRGGNHEFRGGNHEFRGGNHEFRGGSSRGFSGGSNFHASSGFRGGSSGGGRSFSGGGGRSFSGGGHSSGGHGGGGSHGGRR